MEHLTSPKSHGEKGSNRKDNLKKKSVLLKARGSNVDVVGEATSAASRNRNEEKKNQTGKNNEKKTNTQGETPRRTWTLTKTEKETKGI